MFLGDDIIVSDPPCIAQLLAVFEQHGDPVLAVKQVPASQLSRYGVIRGTPVGENVYLVDDLVEKPAPEAAPSDLAIIGRYVLTPDIFPILAETPPDHRGEIQLTDALRRLRARRPIYAVRFTGSTSTPARSSASSRPPWTWRSPGPTSATPSASTCAGSSSSASRASRTRSRGLAAAALEPSLALLVRVGGVC